MGVLGYYVEKGGNEIAQDVFIALSKHGSTVVIYSATEKHTEASEDYVNECRKITKEVYKKASAGYYTPVDYL